jgi:hypothetical protein
MMKTRNKIIFYVLAIISIAGLVYAQSIVKLGYSDGTDRNWAEFRNVGNQLFIVSQDYYDAIVDDKITNHYALHKFGYNGNVGTSEEIIWTAGDGYTYLTSAEILKVASTDVADTAAGTGARTILIEGLDENWAEQQETVTLNGTTAVDTTNTFIRVFRGYNITAGTGEVNAGVITIKNNAETNTLAQIEIGIGQTQMAMWTVPAGHKFFLVAAHASESNNKKVRLRLFTIDRAISNPAYRLRGEVVANLSDVTRPLPLPAIITEKTDIEIRGTASLAGGDVNAGFFGYYEE